MEYIIDWLNLHEFLQLQTMSHQNGSVPLGAPPPYDVVRNGQVSVVEAGPLPVKVALEDDVVIASPEALPGKAEPKDPWASVSSELEGGDNTPWSGKQRVINAYFGCTF